MSAQPPLLNDLLPHGTFVGVSLILPGSNYFLFGIREPKQFDNRLILEVTGIGGGRESHDKTLEDTARREAQEEICSEIKIIDSPKTLIVNNQNSFTTAVLAGENRPVAIVYRHYRTPAHQPWYKDHHGETCLVIYRAEICDQPSPCGELPWLVWLDSTQILATARNDILLKDLLESGAHFVTGQNPLPPLNSLIRLTDSQEALAIALGDESYAFYENVKRLI